MAFLRPLPVKKSTSIGKKWYNRGKWGQGEEKEPGWTKGRSDGMRYTHRRGLARASSWARRKFAALNLKKTALRWACHFSPCLFFLWIP